MPEATLHLRPKAPFDFAHSLAFLSRFRADGVAKMVSEGRVRLPILAARTPLLAELEAAGTPSAPGLLARLTSETPLDDAHLAAAEERLRWYLSLDDDLEPFYALARQDDAFRPIAERLHGYHQVKFESLFACACWALVTQRTPNSFAYKTMQAFCTLLGSSVEVAGERWSAFPPPHRFLEPDAAAKLLAATNNTRKVDRLLPLAVAFATADEQALRSASYDDAYRWLTAIPGLGRWSAEYILLRGLGRHERTPWSDTWLLEGLSQVYTGGFGISRGDARSLAERYGWYQGYWVHYLKVALWL